MGLFLLFNMDFFGKVYLLPTYAKKKIINPRGFQLAKHFHVKWQTFFRSSNGYFFFHFNFCHNRRNDYLTAMPSVHNPCKIGFSKPLFPAKLGSI